MRLLIAGVSVLLLGASPMHSDHSTAAIDARFATPGLRVVLKEVGPGLATASKRYRLIADGFPQGVPFAVFTKHFEHSFEEVAPTLQANGDGRLVSRDLGQPRSLDETVLETGPYPRGASWEVAVVSADRTLSAFARVIPIPIVARDGNCAITLELASRRGLRFLASGTGFASDEEVATVLTYAGRSVRQLQRVSADGRLSPRVISHASLQPDRTVHYTVRGRTCNVVVDYEWGAPALIAR